MARVMMHYCRYRAVGARAVHAYAVRARVKVPGGGREGSSAAVQVTWYGLAGL